MISIIITSFKEPRSIKKAIQAVLDNNFQEKYEVLIVAPDKETLDSARIFSKRNKNIKLIQDLGRGKPAALNLAVSKAKGDVLILTDGDVFIHKDSLNSLLGYFKDKKIGAVSGNPQSISLKNTMLGYWAYVLTNIANKRRKKALILKKRFFCSGYLFAIRKKLFPSLLEELLSEDGFISNKVYAQGYKIAYAENAKVYVKYPTNFKDWILQKRRSAGGYNQIKKLTKVEIRSFKKESKGVLEIFRYVGSIKEFFWILLLCLSRIYLWALIYKDINLCKKKHQEIWQRVESTK